MLIDENVGKTVEKTVKQYQKTIGKKVHDVTETRWVGLDTYAHNEHRFVASEAMFLDYGPKQGVTKCYTVIRSDELGIDLPYPQPPEEGEKVLKAMNHAANQALHQRGIW